MEWRRRVPAQNLWLASVWVVASLFLLTAGLGTADAASRGWPGFRVTAAIVAMAGLFSARLAAGWLVRPWRGAPNYGWGLNLLAAGLMAGPVSFALWTELSPLTRQRLGPAGLGVIVLGWSFALLLITLPCWLDKRRPAPSSPAPWPFWPVVTWAGLTLWSWFRHRAAGN